MRCYICDYCNSAESEYNFGLVVPKTAYYRQTNKIHKDSSGNEVCEECASYHQSSFILSDLINEEPLPLLDDLEEISDIDLEFIFGPPPGSSPLP